MTTEDPDSCIPAPLKDFVFDLHDTARRSHIEAEQNTLYTGTFRELSSKYFAQSAWPSPESIASECGNDPLFLALYRELTHRHLHSLGRVVLADRIKGWQVYRTLFDLLLQEAEDGDGDGDTRTPRATPLYLLPVWAFDVLHEFVYQFQGFCQFRTQQVANAAKSGSGTHKVLAQENLALLDRHRDAWAVETVLFYLHRLVVAGRVVDPEHRPAPAYAHLAVMASVTLSRLECLLGDYRACLRASTAVGDGAAIVRSVFSARLSDAYHAGVSYLMSRRYQDAARVLGDICSDMQRGFKTGQLRKLPGSDQFPKLFDRMVALLAVLTHVCPAVSKRLDDSLNRIIRDKHSSQLAKIESGEEGYEELFIFACPKFVSPAVPDYQVKDDGTSTSNAGQDAYRLQIKQFVLEMNQQKSLRKLRSYMKLYTSIGVSKLAGFNDTKEEEFLARLVCFKHKMRQSEVVEDSSGNTNKKNSTEGQKEHIDSALDIHYYVVGDMVHVDEAEKQRRFENFFMKGIQMNSEIIKDVEKIETVI